MECMNNQGPDVGQTHGETQHLVVLCVHGLPLLCAPSIVLSIKRNPAQLEDDVSLSLARHKPAGIVALASHQSSLLMVCVL